MLAVVLSLIAALSWGTADFLGGLAARRRALLAVMLVSQAAGLVVLAVVALPAAGDVPSWEDVLPAVAGGFAGIIGLSLLYCALAIGRMSVVAPIAALSALVPVLVSIVTGDPLSAVVAAGIVLALGGGAASAAAAPEPGESAETADGSARPDRRARSLWLAIGAALGLGASLVALDAAAEGGALWTVLIVRSTAVAAVLVAIAVRPAPLGLREPGIGKVVLVGVLDAASLTLYTVASTEGLLSVVSVLSSLYPIVTVLLARLVLGERMRAVQVVGVAVAFVGITLIASGS